MRSLLIGLMAFGLSWGTCLAAKPAPGRPNLELAFSDEFEGQQLDKEKWAVESGSPSHIMSSRWPENVEVRGGVLRLVTKAESRGGKEWTTGNIWTKPFTQQYGLFEARMKIAAASGLNNAFWLMPFKAPEGQDNFEIDIVEAHFPNEVSMNLHGWGKPHWGKPQVYKAKVDLSRDFHLYGLEWNEKELIWYFDGNIIRRLPNTNCHAPAPVRLSSAVMKANWAGPVTPALNNTAMEVDHVRVYKLPQAR